MKNINTSLIKIVRELKNKIKYIITIKNDKDK